MAKGKIAPALCAVDQDKVTNSLQQVAVHAATRKINKDANGGKHTLKPDQLVWARCKGKWADVVDSWEDAAEVVAAKEEVVVAPVPAVGGCPLNPNAKEFSCLSPSSVPLVSDTNALGLNVGSPCMAVPAPE